jgi:beta-glucosidase
VLARNGVATVSVDVTNIGKRAGDAVPQLYVHHLASKVARPMQQLVGFQRVHLQAGQTKTVKIPLKAAELAYWNGKALTVEAEPVELRIGDSSADITLKRKMIVR